jgi:hypothetical protein
VITVVLSADNNAHNWSSALSRRANENSAPFTKT